MKKHQFFNLLLLAGLVITISNCGTLTPMAGVTNTCDILIFDNQARFQQVYQALESEVDTIYNRNIGEGSELMPLVRFEISNSFYSYRKLVYDNDLAMNNNQYIDDFENDVDTLFEDDDVLRTLLNRNRLIIIGDSMKLYFDECLTFSVSVGNEKCDQQKIDKLLVIKSALENNDLAILSDTATYSGVTIENSCNNKSDCGIITKLLYKDISCSSSGGTAHVTVYADENITNSLSGSLVKRYWKIDGQTPSPIQMLDEQHVVVPFNGNILAQAINVELKYIFIPTFCTETFTRKIYVSCQECHPCNLTWESTNGDPYNITFTFEDCPTVINNETVSSSKFTIRYGDNTPDEESSNPFFIHQYPHCKKDYRVQYSYVALNMFGQIICEVPFHDAICQNVKPAMCCPDRQKDTCSFKSANGLKKIKYTLKHKPEKIKVLSKYFERNSNGKYKKRKTDWHITLLGPLTFGDSSGCECNQSDTLIAPYHINNRKKVRVKYNVLSYHYLQQGNEWKAKINADGVESTVHINAQCN